MNKRRRHYEDHIHRRYHDRAACSEGGKIEKATFSIIKAVRKKKGQICAWPVDELYPTLNDQKKALLEKDVKQMFRTVTDTELDGEIIRREYPII